MLWQLLFWGSPGPLHTHSNVRGLGTSLTSSCITVEHCHVEVRGAGVTE